MRYKLAVFLVGLALTSSAAFADVPVIDGYDDSNQAATSSTPATVPVQNGDASVNQTGSDDQLGLKVTPATTNTNTSPNQISANIPDNSSLPLKQRVTILEHQVANLTQMLSQYNNMQQQMQDLRGQLDVEKHAMKVLQNQVRSQYQDLDQRLTQSEIKTTRHSRNATANQISKPSIAASDSSSIDTSSAGNNNIDTAENAQTLAPTNAVSAPVPAATAPAVANNADQMAYQTAFNLLKSKNYTQATTAFQKFVRQYPSSPYNTNGRYWLGQLYLLQGQPDKAIGQFHYIMRTNPNSPKIPDTLLQLGLAYYAKGDLQRARIELKRVEQKYPGTNAARLAQTRLQQIQSQLTSSGASTGNQ